MTLYTIPIAQTFKNFYRAHDHKREKKFVRIFFSHKLLTTDDNV